jgi:hypothetical protein
MQLHSLLLTFISITLVNVSNGSDDVIRIPNAQGVGKTVDEATRNAFTDAVQRAVGLYINSTKLLKSDGDAVQEIATFSNGYIVWYEQLQLSDDAQGNKRVLLSCDVSQSRTVERLRKLGVVVAESDVGKVDGKRLFAKEITEKKRNDDAKELLTQLLLQLPTTKDMLRGVELLPIEIVPYKDGESKYSCVIYYRMKYDYEMLTKYCAWVDKTLQKAGFRDRYERHLSHNYANQLNGLLRGERVKLTTNLNPLEYSTFLDLHTVIEKDDDGMGALILLTDFQCDNAVDVNNSLKDSRSVDKQAAVKTSWAVYRMDRRILREVERNIYNKAYKTTISYADGYKAYLGFKPITTKVAVGVLGNNGVQIAENQQAIREFVCFDLYHFFSPPVNLEDNGNGLAVSFITLGNEVEFVNPTKFCKLSFTLNDLSEIQSAQVRLVD